MSKETTAEEEKEAPELCDGDCINCLYPRCMHYSDNEDEDAI